MPDQLTPAIAALIVGLGMVIALIVMVAMSGSDKTEGK